MEGPTRSLEAARWSGVHNGPGRGRAPLRKERGAETPVEASLQARASGAMEATQTWSGNLPRRPRGEGTLMRMLKRRRVPGRTHAWAATHADLAS